MNDRFQGRPRTSQRGRSGLVRALPGLALGLLVSGAAQSQAAVTKAYVEKFEPVATNAAIGNNGLISNVWGAHQPRITVHADGSVRILYVSPNTSGSLTWNLMRRSPAGVWSKETSGQTYDDVALLRDPRDDRAYVLAWPGSVPTVYAAPSFLPVKVPGTWQPLGPTARHYGNAGIGSDGTVCLKASREFNVLPLTSSSNTEYSCGNYNGATGIWTWSAFVSHPIGNRHSYDFIFPNPAGLPAGLYGVAQSDVHKTVPQLNNLATETYVFNGGRFYRTPTMTDKATATDGGWMQSAAYAPLPVASLTVTTPPVRRMQDSLIDSKGRVFSIYYEQDATNTSIRSRNISVTNKDGVVLTEIRTATLPAPGSSRLVEDAKGRIWVLWGTNGSKSTQLLLYPIVESGTAAAPTFTVGAPTDLSAPVFPYVLDGIPYIAAPRGGNAKSLYIEAEFNACANQYVSGANFASNTCYNIDKSLLQRVFYLRIRLPD